MLLGDFQNEFGRTEKNLNNPPTAVGESFRAFATPTPHQIEYPNLTIKRDYRALFDAIPDSVIVVNELGKFQGFLSSNAKNNVHGYDVLESVWPEEVGEGLVKAVKTALFSGKMTSVEYEKTDRFDRNRQYEARLIKQHDTEVIAFIRDITDQKTSEKRLLIQNRAIQVSDSAIALHDPTLTNNPIIFVNDTFKQVTGYDKHEVIGKNFNLLFGELSDPEIVKKIRSAVEEVHSLKTELICYKKNGDTFWNSMRIAPVLDKGELINFVCYNRDITESKNAEEEVRKTKERLQFLVKESHTIIYSTYIGSNCLKSITENVKQVLGYEVEDCVNVPGFLVDNIHFQDASRVKKELGKLHGKKQETLEFRFKNKNGQYLWLQDKVKVILDPQGGEIEVIGYLQDITERKKAELALKIANETLEIKVEERTKALINKSIALENFSTALKFLHKINTQKYADIDELFSSYLRYGCKILGMQEGLITELVDDQLKFKKVISANSPTFESGTVIDVDMALCKNAIIEEATVFYTDIAQHPEVKQLPAHQEYSIASYLGTPIRVNDSVFGSLGFISKDSKGWSFQQYELEIIEMMAKNIGNAIATHLEEEKRKVAEKELKDSRNLYLTLAQNIPSSAVFLFDKDLKYLLAVGQALQEQGFDGSEMIGKTIFDVLPTKSANRLAKYYQSALDGNEQKLSIHHKGKSYETFFLPIKNDNDKVFAGMVVSRDVTERKVSDAKIRNLNKQLKQKINQLQSINNELESFSYSVSHDLRAPLRAIDGFSKILLEDYAEKVDEEGKRLLKILSKNSQKMGALIDDLLSFSRMSRQEKYNSKFNIGGLFQDVFNELKFQKGAINHAFEIGDMPDITADKNMMRLVITNLLGNAIKFTATQPKPAITVNHYLENQKNIFYVKDNGVGFNDKYSHKLFGVFQRLHSDEEFEGTGVGLALVNRIIRRHDGKVWASSQLGQGATFYFSLPKMPANDL
ncbi:MAG: PAS domain S-box protein [Bacteroidota bacterium]